MLVKMHMSKCMGCPKGNFGRKLELYYVFMLVKKRVANGKSKYPI